MPNSPRAAGATRGSRPPEPPPPEVPHDPERRRICAGYRMFLDHVAPRLAALLNLIRQGRPASDILRGAKG